MPAELCLTCRAENVQHGTEVAFGQCSVDFLRTNYARIGQSGATFC